MTEMIDTKLDYFAKEIAEFMSFMASVADDDDDERITMVNTPNLALLLNDFYDENGSRYNESQLVYQFIKKMGGKKILKAYSLFKKVRSMDNY